MNSKMTAIKNKVNAGERKIASGFKKTTNAIGNVLSRPTRLDHQIFGDGYDKRRESIRNKRESRANDKAMGY